MACGCKNKQAGKATVSKTTVTKPSNPVNNGASGSGTRRIQKRIIR